MTSKPAIGIMGGTFDPIHNGHLIAASDVKAKFNLEKIIFVPSGSKPPLKSNITTAEHRYLMTVIATSSNPDFFVSRLEVDEKGISYTAQTLEQLKKIYPKHDLYFITGADNITQIPSWQNANKIFQLAKIVGVSRPGYCMNEEIINQYNVEILEIPALSISSSEIRNRVKNQMPTWYLTPDGVVQYIQKNRLYF